MGFYREIACSLAAGALLAGCAGSPAIRSAVAEQFRAQFGFLPSPQVTQIRSHVSPTPEGRATWLAFTYDQATIERILQSGYAPPIAEGPEMMAALRRTPFDPRARPPGWFHVPGQGAGTVYYPLNAGTAATGNYLWVDESTHTVYARRVERR